MMKKKIYSPFRKLRLLMVLPLMAIVFYAFARPEYVENDSKSIENTVNQTTITAGTKVMSFKTDLSTKVILYNEDGKPIVASSAGFNLLMKDDDPLILLDDRNISKSEISGIKEGTISSINVYDKKIAEEKFGDIGKHGVIVIKSKSLEIISDASKEGKVKGTVTNEKGNPLEGAAVIIKGTTMGTTTDANGDFVLKNVPPDAELVISYVGFKTEKLKPDFNHRMKVQLGVSTVGIGKISINAEETAPKKSDDVQVIGYGVTKKGEPNISKLDKSSFVVVEQMPEFPGGQLAMMKYLRENIKYPTQAKGEKAQGTVIVKFTVNKAGKIKDAKVIKGIHKDLDDEALRVISSMPDWNPGKQNGKPVEVEFTIPVEFSLQDNKSNITSKNFQIRLKDNSIAIHPDYPPLILLDGKEITNEERLKINQNSIGSISVLKDESATNVYGEKGRNGVIIIKSKQWNGSDLGTNDLYFYREIDEKPQFPGGKSEMMRFLARNLKYPVIASEKGGEGTAVVRFTVTKTGQIDNVNVINDVDPSLKSEAVRSIMKMPVWDPGKKNGKAVDVVCTIPFKFIINKSGTQQTTGDTRSLSGDFGEVIVVGYGSSKTLSEPTAEEDRPFVNVEAMPEFPGGTKELMKFIQSNLQYPPLAKENGVVGTIIIQFVVKSDGKVENIKVIRGIGSGCDEEAIRVLKLMPDWTPGKQGGKAVNVYYTLPFRFALSPSSSTETKPMPPPPPPVSSGNQGN